MTISRKLMKPESGAINTKMNMVLILLFITTTATGLLAGLFYGYSCSVNNGLGDLSDSGYLEAFQSINRNIQNPVFMLTFLGNAILLPLTTILLYKSGPTVSSHYLLIALTVYFIGVLGITIFCNVPLHDQLDSYQIRSASLEELSVIRKSFEEPWNRFHAIRTIAAIVSFGAT